MADQPMLCVDMGTTRTRVWLVRGRQICAYVTGDFGVRNVAMGQTSLWLKEKLSELLLQAWNESSERPVAVLAAGMITSEQGLRDVPQAEAPASTSDLAARLYRDQITLSDTVSLPLLLVPGVRTGAFPNDPESALEMDLMRGEETLCCGLLAQSRLRPGDVLLNLGSHWKYIWIDGDGRIARSRTSLTGEMIHAVQAHTLLASALPQAAPTYLDSDWLEMGFVEASKSGLSRSLFCLRLLQLAKQGSTDERLAFLYGAFLQSELSLLASQSFSGKELLLVGPECLTGAWKQYAEKVGIRCSVIFEDERRDAYLSGLLLLFRHGAGIRD